MNRFNQILIAALVVQIVLAGGIYFGSRTPSAEQTQMALLSADKSRINRITIDEGDDRQTVLSKVDGTWQLPGYHQLPANQSKVDELIARLETTNSGWPVATTESSRHRFKVGDEDFQKKVILSNGDDALLTLYLGTSPGFRQLHIRKAGEDEVYAVKLNSYDFPSQNADWLDKTLLQPEGDIAGLKGPDFSLDKQNDSWQLAEGTGEVIKEEINKITGTLKRLTVQGVEDKPVDKSSYELSVTAAGNTHLYRFFKEGSDHYLSRDDYAEVFKINKSDYEQITGLSATQLVKKTDIDETNRDS